MSYGSSNLEIRKGYKTGFRRAGHIYRASLVWTDRFLLGQPHKTNIELCGCMYCMYVLCYVLIAVMHVCVCLYIQEKSVCCMVILAN